MIEQDPCNHSPRFVFVFKRVADSMMFVELEDGRGNGMSAGTWSDKGDGTHELTFDANAVYDAYEAFHKPLCAAGDHCYHDYGMYPQCRYCDDKYI